MQFLVAAAELQSSRDDQLEIVEDDDVNSRPAKSSVVLAGNEEAQLRRIGMCASLSLLHKLNVYRNTRQH